MERIQFQLNSKPMVLSSEPTRRLVDVLREDLDLTGTKEGCGIGECGACTILIDDEPVTACLVMVGQVAGKRVLTIEGLSDHEIGRVLQRCFTEEGAVQCGFCTPGMLMSAYALLCRNPTPTREEIRVAMSGNLCRCTGYVPILNAIERCSAQTAGVVQAQAR